VERQWNLPPPPPIASPIPPAPNMPDTMPRGMGPRKELNAVIPMPSSPKFTTPKGRLGGGGGGGGGSSSCSPAMVRQPLVGVFSADGLRGTPYPYRCLCVSGGGTG
jgi:hypothetical protein